MINGWMMEEWMDGGGWRAWMDRWIVVDEKKKWMHEVMDEQRATKKEVGGSGGSKQSQS